MSYVRAVRTELSVMSLRVSSPPIEEPLGGGPRACTAGRNRWTHGRRLPRGSSGARTSYSDYLAHRLEHACQRQPSGTADVRDPCVCSVVTPGSRSTYRHGVAAEKLRRQIADRVSGCEVEVRVGRAAGVEGGAAARAGVRREVLGDGHGGAADAAEGGREVVLSAGDHLERVVGDRRVAEVARVPGVAAGGAEGHDVERRAVVDAAGLGVDRRAADGHGLCVGDATG
jgi:hypothetical protein